MCRVQTHTHTQFGYNVVLFFYTILGYLSCVRFRDLFYFLADLPSFIDIPTMLQLSIGCFESRWITWGTVFIVSFLDYWFGPFWCMIKWFLIGNEWMLGLWISECTVSSNISCWHWGGSWILPLLFSSAFFIMYTNFSEWCFSFF